MAQPPHLERDAWAGPSPAPYGRSTVAALAAPPSNIWGPGGRNQAPPRGPAPLARKRRSAEAESVGNWYLSAFAPTFAEASAGKKASADTPTPSASPVSPLRGLPPEAEGVGWWSQPGSNRRPLQCHCSALPTELWPRMHAYVIRPPGTLALRDRHRPPPVAASRKRLKIKSWPVPGQAKFWALAKYRRQFKDDPAP